MVVGAMEEDQHAVVFVGKRPWDRGMRLGRDCCGKGVRGGSRSTTSDFSSGAVQVMLPEIEMRESERDGGSEVSTISIMLKPQMLIEYKIIA